MQTTSKTKSNRTRKQTTVRIGCLLPGLTDVVHDLGFSKAIVANTHECATETHSKSVTKPKLNETKTLSAGEIAAGWNVVTSENSSYTRRTLDMLSTHICSFYDVDMVKLGAISPTVLLTDICQPRMPVDPSEEDIKHAIRKYIPSLKTIITLKYQSLADVMELHHATARALGDPSAAVDAVAKARTRLHAVEGKASKRAKKIAVVQWTNPLYVAGDWVPEILQLAGGAADAITSMGGPSMCVSASSLLQMDMVIFAICAVDLSGCNRIVKAFWKDNAKVFVKWPGKFFITDATKLYSRPAVSTVVQSAEVTAEIASGNNLFGHKGVLWEEWKRW